MIDCKRCGTRHEGWNKVACNRAKTMLLTQATAPLTHPFMDKPRVNTDRHKPGYMADYMRKRRAAK